MRLGAFDLSDAQIQANSFNIPFLNSHFTLVDSARIGDNIGTPSNFQITRNLEVSSVAGEQIYYWVFESTDNSTLASSFNTAVRWGIYYFDKSFDNDWAFPSDVPVPAVIANDITDLTNGAGNALDPHAHVVVGTFPLGASTFGGASNFAVMTPEPSSAMLAGVGALGLLARRRRDAS